MSEIIESNDKNEIQEWYSSEKLEVIRKTLAKDVPALEFELFINIAKQSGLNPLMRQIYPIMRGGKLSIQTAIDGFRSMACRTNCHIGTSDTTFVMKEDGVTPYSATITVKKLVSGHVCEFTSTCYWDEYVGSTPLWNKLKRGMLSKCTEALTLRKAFPEVLSGLYTSDEMSQADAAPSTTISSRAKEADRLADSYMESIKFNKEVGEVIKSAFDANGKTTNKSHTKQVSNEILEAAFDIVGDTKSLVSTSLVVANGGLEALTEWFKGLSKDQQGLIKGHMAEAKKIAIEVDKKENN